MLDWLLYSSHLQGKVSSGVWYTLLKTTLSLEYPTFTFIIVK